jgi:uncharacterized protein
MVESARPLESQSEPPLETLVPGFWQDTPAGRIFVIEQRFELDHRHGSYGLGQTLDVPASVLARLDRRAQPERLDHSRILYLDTETTGLAGGTGTLAFLVGVGHFLDGGFRLRQYFLDSLDREPALLFALSGYLESFDTLVTYNGKRFDVPLLESRFILNRMPDDIGALSHLDLLFTARRIYRDRFASCRLGEIERQVLGLIRPDDVPSFEVPGLYFRYVRFRRLRALLPVFRHNALDILSLVTLTSHLGALYQGGDSLSPADDLALAQICERDGITREAIDRYQRALRSQPTPAQRDEAECRLSLLYKRARQWPQAAELWRQMAERFGNHAVFPLSQLALYHERQTRDAQKALSYAEAALDLLRRHHLRLHARHASKQEVLLCRRVERLRRSVQRPAGAANG